MRFQELNTPEKVEYIKREFSILVKSIFDTPEILKSWINEKHLSNGDAKSILKLVNGFNSKTCGCCRRYDPNKLKLIPVDPELEPILDLARSVAEKKVY
jgi:hypothetical protein